MVRRCGGAHIKSINDRVLWRNIEAVGKKNPSLSVEDVVDNLRSRYPYYARHKLRPFKKQVERVMMVYSQSNIVAMENSGDDMDTSIPKKRRKTDEEKEKIEALGDGGSSTSLSSITSASKKLLEERTSKKAVELEEVDNKGVKSVNEECENLTQNDGSIVMDRAISN